MDGYDSEREQLEAIKKWWSENGTWLVLGLALGVAALFGYRYWEDYRIQRAESASANYENFLSFVDRNEPELALSTGEALVNEFGSSVYAALTALHLARIEVAARDFEAAAGHLEWVVANTDVPEIRELAELRRFRIMLDTGRADDAAAGLERLLEKDSIAHLELAADIQAATGQLDAAVATYEKILSRPGLAASDRALFELKLDAVGK